MEFLPVIFLHQTHNSKHVNYSPVWKIFGFKYQYQNFWKLTQNKFINPPRTIMQKLWPGRWSCSNKWLIHDYCITIYLKRNEHFHNKNRKKKKHFWCANWVEILDYLIYLLETCKQKTITQVQVITFLIWCKNHNFRKEYLNIIISREFIQLVLTKK